MILEQRAAPLVGRVRKKSAGPGGRTFKKRKEEKKEKKVEKGSQEEEEDKDEDEEDEDKDVIKGEIMVEE